LWPHPRRLGTRRLRQGLQQEGFHGKATTLVGLPATIVCAPIPDTTQVLAKLSGILGPNHDPISQWVPGSSSIVTADLSFAKQAWWAGQVAEAGRARLLMVGTARDFVRLTHHEGPFASAWLSAIPKRSLNNIRPDTDFRRLCKFWLGLPLLPGRGRPSLIVRYCPAIDPFDDHFTTCRKNGITKRHNALRDAWVQVLTSAGIRQTQEVTVPGGDRPDDILMIRWDKGTDVCIGFTVTSPLALDAFPLNTERPVGRARKCGKRPSI